MSARILYIIILFVIYIAVIFASPDTAQEDALITARYSRNLVEIGQLVYNPGELVLGTTTPLWAFLISPIFILPYPEPLLIKIIQIFSTLFALASIELATRSLRSRPSSILIIGLCPPTLHMATAGMETAMLCYFGLALNQIAWLETCGQNKPRWRWILLCCLMIATRLDASLLILSIYATTLWHTSPLSRQIQLLKKSFNDAVIVALFSALFLYSIFSFYGLPVPHSMLAKAGVGASSSLIEFQETLVRNLFNLTGFNWPWPRILWPLNILTPLFLIISMYFSLKSSSSYFRITATVVAFYIVAYALFLTVGGAGVFPWYANVPGTLIAISIVGSSIESQRRWITAIATTGVALTASLTLRHSASREISSNHRVGLELSERVPSLVATEPIGYVGFYCRCRILDFAGLVSPQVLSYRRGLRAGWFTKLIYDRRPQYVLLRQGEVDANLGRNIGILFETPQDREWFLKAYVMDYKLTVREGESFELFRQRD